MSWLFENVFLVFRRQWTLYRAILTMFRAYLKSATVSTACTSRHRSDRALMLSSFLYFTEAHSTRSCGSLAYFEYIIYRGALASIKDDLTGRQEHVTDVMISCLYVETLSGIFWKFSLIFIQNEEEIYYNIHARTRARHHFKRKSFI